MNRHTATMLLAVTLLLAGAGATHAFEWITLAPEDDGDIAEFKIAGYERIYHRLEPGEAMYYDVNEHETIRVITRADLRGTDSDELVYTFRLGYDDMDGLRLFARATSPDNDVLLKGKGGVAGHSRILLREPPRSAKRLYISVDDDAPAPVFFRVQRDRFETIRQEDFVAYTPSRYETPVSVSVRENVLTYYGVDPAGNLEVSVNGPTVVKVLVRVMMDDKMRSTIKFPLAIYEDGVLKRTVLISTSASDVAVLPDRPDRRPTRGDDIYINVPDGNHSYTFDLPENGYEAILRFFIPETDLDRSAD